MPYSTNPAHYPTEFADAAARALEVGELEIPTMGPASFRRHFQAYLKALATPEAADLMVRISDKGVVICRRSHHPAARAIAAVLGSGESPEEAFIRRLNEHKMRGEA